MDLGEDADIYLARVAWRTANTLTATIQPRDQQSLRLLEFNPATGSGAILIEEHMGNPDQPPRRDTLPQVRRDPLGQARIPASVISTSIPPTEKSCAP